MDTRSEALAGLPYNIRRIETRSRSWNDMRLDVTGAWYEEGEILHPLGNEDSTRLIMMVEERGGFAEARESKRVPCPADHRLPNSMAFGPAGMPLWGYARTNTYCRDASFIFDIGHLSEKLQHHVSQEQLSSPRLRFNDQRLWTLGKMLVDIPEDDASARLYGESLTAAIFAILFQSNETVASPGSLAPWQLRRVVEYLKAKLPEQVELQELSGCRSGISPVRSRPRQDCRPTSISSTRDCRWRSSTWRRRTSRWRPWRRLRVSATPCI